MTKQLVICSIAVELSINDFVHLNYINQILPPYNYFYVFVII